MSESSTALSSGATTTTIDEKRNHLAVFGKNFKEDYLPSVIAALILMGMALLLEYFDGKPLTIKLALVNSITEMTTTLQTLLILLSINLILYTASVLLKNLFLYKCCISWGKTVVTVISFLFGVALTVFIVEPTMRNILVTALFLLLMYLLDALKEKWIATLSRKMTAVQS